MFHSPTAFPYPSAVSPDVAASGDVALVVWETSWTAADRTYNIHGRRLNVDILKQKGSGYVASHGKDFLLANDAYARFINMRYGRDDELESDALGIRIMAEAGYDPRAMLGVMRTLAKASGGSRQPEFFSTHPHPENREARIREEIAKRTGK